MLFAAPVLVEDVALEDDRDGLGPAHHVLFRDDVLPLAVVDKRRLVHNDADTDRDVHGQRRCWVVAATDAHVRTRRVKFIKLFLINSSNFHNKGCPKKK